MNRVFKLNSDICYNLKHILQYSSSQLRSLYHGRDNISYLGSKIWNILPDYFKVIGNLGTFKFKIKKWEPENCSHGLFKA